MSTFQIKKNYPIEVHNLVICIFLTFSVLWLLISAVLICTEINFHFDSHVQRLALDCAIIMQSFKS